jgi:hypothetical protein
VQGAARDTFGRASARVTMRRGPTTEDENGVFERVPTRHAESARYDNRGTGIRADYGVARCCLPLYQIWYS